LSAPGGQGSEKVLELSQVADLAKCADIPFKIGLDIAGVPKAEIPPGICLKLRVASSKEFFPEFEIREFGRLRRCLSGLPWQ
jgi:hypothetical protein